MAIALVAASGGRARSAPSVDDQNVPADTCILELTMPDDAMVTIDGRDFGTKRRLVYRSLEPGKRYTTTLQVRFADGSTQQRKVFVQGGRVVRERFEPRSADGHSVPWSVAEPKHSRVVVGKGRPDLVVQTGHAQTTQCATLSRDGRYLATGALGGKVFLWDTATGHKLRSFERHHAENESGFSIVQSLAFSPDGKLLLVGYFAEAILWDKVSGAKLRTFRSGQHQLVNSVAFSPDGATLLIGSGSYATLWETASGRLVRTFRTGSHVNVRTAAFSPQGRYVITGHDNGTTTMWDARTGAPVQTFTESRTDLGPGLMNGIFGSLGSAASKLGSAASKEAMESMNEGLRTPSVKSVACSPSETKLVTAASNGNVTLWEVGTGKKLGRLDAQAFGGVDSVVFSGDGRQILTCSAYGPVLWDVATRRKLSAASSPTTAMVLDPKGPRMLTGHQDGTVSLWDTVEMKKLWTVPAAANRVMILAFSPRGEEFVSCGMMDRTVTLRSLNNGAKLREFQVPPMELNVPPYMQNLMRSQGMDYSNMGSILAAVFGAGGRTLITGSMHMDMGSILSSTLQGAPARRGGSPRMTLKLTSWNTLTGEEVWSMETAFDSLAGGVTFTLSPDRRMFLIGTPSGTSIRDAETGRELHRLPGKRYPNPLHSVAFSPDGRLLLICSGENAASLIDLSTGKELRRLAGHRAAVTCVAFSPDGRKVITGSADKTAILWDATTGRQVRRLEGHKDAIMVAEFSPDGKRVLTSSRDDASILWDVSSGARLHSLPGKDGLAIGSLGSSSFTSDSRGVSTGGNLTGRFSLWDAVTGECRYDSRGGTAGGAICAALGPKGEPLVVGRQGVTGLSVTDARTAGVLCRIEGHSCTLQSLSVASQSMDVLVGLSLSRHGPVLWDAAFQHNSQLQGGLPLIGYAPVQAMISADGRRVFTAVRGVASIWDASSGRRLCMLEGVARYVYVSCAVFSPDGKRLITSLPDKDAVLWDAATGKKLQVLQTERTVRAAAFSPDGRYVLTNGGKDFNAILWKTATGERVRDFPSGSGESVAFAPDGQRAATAGGEGIIIWDTAGGKKLRAIEAHGLGSPTCLVFAPDGKTIAAGDDYGAVGIWNVSTGEKLAALHGHTGKIISVSFRSEGKQLLTGSNDGTIRLWDAATGEEFVRLFHLDGGKDWLAVTPDGLFDGSASGRQNVMFRFGGGLNVVPVDRFFQDFYYPGLLAAIARGERPKPHVALAGSLPPRVRIVGAPAAGTVKSPRVTLEVEVTDQGGGVRGPWLVHNGAWVLVPGKTEREGKLVRRRFDVALIEGDNRLQFHAASADGSWESEPAVITFHYDKPLPKPELYLLAVGVNDYAEDRMDLRFARADATAMAELFRQRGPALYPKVHVASLLDGQATRPAVLGAIRSAAQHSRPQDTLVVYLAGQGTVVGGQYYFLPHEFRRQAATLEEDVRRQGIWAGQIRDRMEAVPALKRMLVFDTGQSGGAMGLTRTARDPFAFRGAVERLSRATGTYIIAAAAVSDEAKEVPELGHGVLSYTLLAGLHAAKGGPLQDQWIEPSRRDRVAEALEWFGFASSGVRKLTKQYFGRQQDVQHSIAGMSFPVLPVPESAEPVQVDTVPPSKPVVRREPVRVQPGVGQSKLYLVAIGINQYAEEAMNLDFARRDAEAMAELFRRRGATVYRQIQANLVVDKRATKTGILEAIGKLAKRAHPEDTLAVFLAGHGKMVGQRYYFIPHEFHRQADNLEEDVRNEGLPADVLADAISKVPTRKRILILDTCASGGALKLSRQGQDPFAFRGAIEKLATRQGVFTIAAAGAGEEAQEIRELGHGVLTYALLAGLNAVPPGGPLEGLEIHPTTPDGRVDVLEWFSFAAGHVPRLTKRYLGRAQEVHIGGQGTSFPVLPVSRSSS